MQTNPTLWRPGLPVIFPAALVLQLVEKVQAEGLRRSGRIPKEVAILLVGATLCPGRTNRPCRKATFAAGLGSKDSFSETLLGNGLSASYSKTQCPIFSVNRHAYRG